MIVCVRSCACCAFVRVFVCVFGASLRTHLSCAQAQHVLKADYLPMLVMNKQKCACAPTFLFSLLPPLSLSLPPSRHAHPRICGRDTDAGSNLQSLPVSVSFHGHTRRPSPLPPAQPPQAVPRGASGVARGVATSLTRVRIQTLLRRVWIQTRSRAARPPSRGASRRPGRIGPAARSHLELFLPIGR